MLMINHADADILVHTDTTMIRSAQLVFPNGPCMSLLCLLAILVFEYDISVSWGAWAWPHEQRAPALLLPLALVLALSPIFKHTDMPKSNITSTQPGGHPGLPHFVGRLHTGAHSSKLRSLFPLVAVLAGLRLQPGVGPVVL